MSQPRAKKAVSHPEVTVICPRCRRITFIEDTMFSEGRRVCRFWSCSRYDRKQPT